MIKFLKNKKYKRGISMAEVVISLTIITIVTSAALMLITSNTRAQAQSAAVLSATNTVENAIECYRFAEDEEAFCDLFFGKVLEIEQPNGNGSYEFEYNGVSYEMTIDSETSTISVYASALNDTYRFTK